MRINYAYVIICNKHNSYVGWLEWFLRYLTRKHKGRSLRGTA